jgi:copper(I)-binding protein
LTAALLGAASAVALAGCGAGMITQTSEQVAPVPGINADAGQIALRNIVVAYDGPAGYPAGGDAPLVVRLFNNGTTPVTLTGVSSSGAASVTLVGTPSVTPSPSPTAAASPSASASASAEPSVDPSASASAEPSGSAEPSASASPSPAAPPPAPSEPVSIVIPPQSYVLLVPGEGDSGYLRLNGLTAALVPGAWIPVTFTFDNGEEAELQVPLAPPLDAVPRGAADEGEGGGH